MRTVLPLALAALFALAGCGDDDSGAPAPPPEDPAAGNPPPADPGTTPPGTSPPPSDTPPPPTTAACEGLVPESPGPGVGFALERVTGGFAFCNDPLTDGRGEWVGVGSGLRVLAYQFVRAAAPGEPAGRLALPRSSYGSPFAPQPDGYHAIRSRDQAGTFLRADATGNVLEEGDRHEAWAIEGVPGGGSVLFTEERRGFDEPFVYRLVWMDPSGAPRAETVLPGARKAFVVAADGKVLAFSGELARWFDRNGAPLTDWFSYDTSGGWTETQMFRAAVLADGSVVVGLGGTRPLRFEGGVAGAAPPPAWVTSRAGATIATVRGGRANAFAFASTSGRCRAEIEILTPGGESCGTVVLDAPACDRLTFGADRTVFTTHEAPDGTCTWRWWTGLLR